MARRTRTIRVDDLDGTEGARSVAFGLDGVSYRIDLSRANDGELRTVLAPYLEVARRTSAEPSTTCTTREQNARIRAWAREQGWLLCSRGRLPRAVVHAFHAAPGER